MSANASCSRIMLAHRNQHLRNRMLSLMHGRTDGRTYVEPPSQRDHLQFVNAHETSGDFAASLGQR